MSIPAPTARIPREDLAMDPTSTPTRAPAPAPAPDHRVKVAHLVLALLFLGAAAAWALVAGGALDAAALPFLGPALLVLAGVGGLVAVLLGTRRRAPAPTPTSAPADHAPVTMDDPHDVRHDDPHDDPHDDLEHTAPLHRPEDPR